MKTNLQSPPGESKTNTRSRAQSALKLTLLLLALIGLVGTAQATIYTNVNNASLSLNDPNDWLVAPGVTPSTPPGSSDTIWFSGAGVTSALGGSLSVNGIVVDNTVTGTPRIGATAGATLTIGAGGITKTNTGSITLQLSCALALGTNQVWTNAAGTIMLDRNSLTFNGYNVTVLGSSTLDFRCATKVSSGANMNIRCTTSDINNSGADIDFGTGTNSFTTFTIYSIGTMEGSTFPTNALATTYSAFGAGSCSLSLGASVAGAGTLVYNGNTVATPEKITWGATATNTINVTTAGQTLTLSNLLFASGASQTANYPLNFGGAGNLTLIKAVSNAPSSSFSYYINKSGSGTLTLTGTNIYSGNTLVNGGTFALTGTSSISNSPLISLAGGTTFDVSGLSSTFVLQASQTISNMGTATVTLNGSITNTSGTIAGNFKAGDAPFTITNGTLTISSGTVFNLNYGGSSRLAVGTTFPIVTKGAGGSVSGTPPNTGTGTITFSGWTGHLTNNSGELDMVVDTATLQGTEPLHWAGAGTGTWDVSDTSNTNVWHDSTMSSPLSVYYADGDTVQFDEKYISANQAVELDTTVNPTSILVSNATYNYTISGGGTIGGSGGLTKLGAATLTLSTPNTYTGGTVISNGTVQMGNPTALGAKGATVFVNSGAVLDVNGTTMTSANTNILTLNGSGPAGGGALINSSATAANFFGSIALGSASTIAASGGSLTLGSGSTDPITGNYPLTFGGANQVDAFGNIQVASVTVASGTFRIESANAFAGGLWVLTGSAIAKNAASYGGNGTGTIYLLNTNGSGNGTLNLGVSSVLNNTLIVQAGSSGTANMNTYGAYTPTWAGSITLSNGLTLQAESSSGNTLAVTGPIGGPGALTIANSYANDIVNLSGTNTYSGATYVNLGTLALSGSGSISNTSLITVAGGATFDVSALGSGITLGSAQTLANSSAATANLNGTINTGTGTVTVNYDGSDYVFNNQGSLNLNLSAGTVFNVFPTTGLSLTTYTLVASGVAGTAPATVNMPRGGGYLQISGGALQLVVTNNTSGATEPLHWAGTGTGLWQLATPTNVWKDSSVTPVYTGFFPGDLVQFDEPYINTNQVVTLNSTVTPPGILVSNSAYNYTISGTGTIGGSASLTKTGNSNLVVQCALNLSGAFTNNGGTVQLVSGWPMTVGSLAGVGSSLDLTTNTLTVNQGGLNTTYSGVIHGYYPASAGTIGSHAFGLYVTNSGVLTLNSNISLSADASTLPASSGYARISAGNSAEIDLDGAITLTNVSLRNGNTAITRVNGGTVNQTSTNTYFGIVLGDSSQFIVDNGSVSVPVVSIGFGGATTAGGSSLTINNGSLSVGAGNGRGLEIGNNVSSGTTSTINLNGGTLTAVAIVDGPPADPSLTQSGNNIINFNGGTLVCASTNVIANDGGYNGSDPLQLLVGNGGAVINTAGYNNTIGLPLQNNGSGGLTKLGLGTLTLTNDHTYVGPTVVSNGTLLVDGSITSAVTVNGGTLGGTGTVNSVTVNAGGTLSQAGAIGTLTVNGNLTLAGNTVIQLDKDLSPAQSNDTVNVSGTINYGGTLTVTNIGTTPLVAGDSFTVFKSGGSGSFSVTGNAGSGLAFHFANGVITVVSSGPSGPGYITNSISGNNLTLTWPAGQGWRLVSQTNSLSVGLTTDGWNTVPGGIDGSNGVTINPNNPTVFYKLVNP